MGCVGFPTLARAVRLAAISSRCPTRRQGVRVTIDAAFAGLPTEIREAIVTAPVVEWVSSTARGLAIDTPALMFANADTGTLDVTTGLAYPAKAERARRAPQVGLAVGASGAGQPVVVMRALATVRDS